MEVHRSAGAAARARRPPLMAERCLRTQFISEMLAPLFKSALLTACFSSSVTPSAGSAISAEPPPRGLRGALLLDAALHLKTVGPYDRLHSPHLRASQITRPR